LQGRSPGCRGLTWWRPGEEGERELGKKEREFFFPFPSSGRRVMMIEREGDPLPDHNTRGKRIEKEVLVV